MSAPTPAAVIVPGALVRVRPDADSRFAARSGLVVAVDAGAALVRFAGVRTYAFAAADLQSVASFTASTSPVRGAPPSPRTRDGRPPALRPAAGRSLPPRPAPSSPSAPGTRTRARAGGESSSLEPRRRSNRKVTDDRH